MKRSTVMRLVFAALLITKLNPSMAAPANTPFNYETAEAEFSKLWKKSMEVKHLMGGWKFQSQTERHSSLPPESSVPRQEGIERLIFSQDHGVTKVEIHFTRSSEPLIQTVSVESTSVVFETRRTFKQKVRVVASQNVGLLSTSVQYAYQDQDVPESSWKKFTCELARNKRLLCSVGGLFMTDGAPSLDPRDGRVKPIEWEYQVFER